MSSWNISEFLYENKISEKESQIISYKDQIVKDLKYIKIKYDIDVLNTLLESYQKMSILIEEIYVFYSHQFDIDMSDSKIQDKKNRFIAFYQNLVLDIADFEDIILSISGDVAADFEKTEFYTTIKEIIRFKNFTFTKREEQLISLSTQLKSCAYDIYSTLVTTEVQFMSVEDKDAIKHEFDENKWSVYCLSNDRILRESSFKSLLEGYQKYNKTISQIISSHLKGLLISVEQRGYDSILKSALFKNDIDKNIYDQLINSVNENIHVNHKYLALRSKVMGHEIHLYDVYTPLFKSNNEQFEYEEAVTYVKNSLKIMPEEYQEVVTKIFNENCVDVYPDKNKRGGAYSGGCYTSNPYILLNYTKTLNDVFTVAHELGHSVHSYFSNKNQSYLNSNYKIFVAEVASIVNEFILLDYMIKEYKTNEEKLDILNHKLEMYRTTLVRQTMFAEFEKHICEYFEENKAINYEYLNNFYYNLNKVYFGKEVVVDDLIKFEWSRIDHFYYNFYVYQYATSFCVANAVAHKISSGDKVIVEKYLVFLKSGCSKNANELILDLGIDLSDKEIYDKTFLEYSKTIDEVENLWRTDAKY